MQRILVVDDRPEVCALVEQRLSDQEHSITPVPDAERALAILAASSSDVSGFGNFIEGATACACADTIGASVSTVGHLCRKHALHRPAESSHE